MINLTNKFIEPRRYQLLDTRHKIASRVWNRTNYHIVLVHICNNVFGQIWLQIRRHLERHIANDKIK